MSHPFREGWEAMVFGGMGGCNGSATALQAPTRHHVLGLGVSEVPQACWIDSSSFATWVWRRGTCWRQIGRRRAMM